MLQRALVLAGLLATAACGPISRVDDALRRVDVLDRIFEPRRAEPYPAAGGPIVVQPAPYPYQTAPYAVPPGPVVVERTPPPPVLKDPAPLMMEPEPAPAIVAMDPLPDPPAASTAPAASAAAQATPAAAPPRRSIAEVVRREPWLTRFWSELTPAQQGRIRRQIPERSAERWDAMGLPERARLLGGV